MKLKVYLKRVFLFVDWRTLFEFLCFKLKEKMDSDFKFVELFIHYFFIDFFFFLLMKSI